MFLKVIKILFVCLVLFSSCKSKKNVVSKKRTSPRTEKVAKKKVVVQEEKRIKKETDLEITPIPEKASYSEVVALYIENYKEIAKNEMREYGIPASITLAQGILESGAGRGKLSSKSNNHFGIKCHKGWEGERVYHDDDELQECFRKYEHPMHSFRDHSLFLTGRSRYADLFKHELDDYKSWAKGLKKAGYATDPKYPNKLISIIEKHELHKYDSEVLGKKQKKKSSKKKKAVSNKTYTVVKGDTLYSLSRKFNISVDDIKKLNKLKSNNISIGQQLKIK